MVRRNSQRSECDELKKQKEIRKKESVPEFKRKWIKFCEQEGLNVGKLKADLQMARR